ncbi:hypothetical protein GCK32_022535, partial [Trichostrongylus colubriformis]
MEDVNPSQMQPALYEEVYSTENSVRMDPRDLQSIINAVRAEASQATSPPSTSKPSFKREGSPCPGSAGVDAFENIDPWRNRFL